jgi:hypothetical protein
VSTVNNRDGTVHRHINARLTKQVAKLIGFEKSITDIDKGRSSDTVLFDLGKETNRLNIGSSVASKLICHKSGNLAPELGLRALSGIQGQNCNFQHEKQFTGQGRCQVQ